MIEVERLFLIGCLLQGALSRHWAVWMPQSIEALAGSCVLIPCRFEIHPDYDKNLVAEANGERKKRSTGGERVFNSSFTPEQNIINGKFIGDLLKKNCTTVLDRFPLNYNDKYFFRLECPNDLKANFHPGVQINVKASPPKPKLTPEKVEVMEGTSVSLSCSAAAPCPKLPPNLTWTPSLSDSVDQLQENEDQTKSVSSVLTITASHLHHRQKITCRALYKLQQGDIQKISNISLTLRVIYSPKNTSVSVSPSGSVIEGSSVTLTCSSDANPRVQTYTWYKVNGREMNTVGTGQNLTFNVASGSEQYYCVAQNKHGKQNSTTVQLGADRFSITWLLIGAAAVAMVIVIMMFILKKKRDSWCSRIIMKDIKAVTDESPPRRSPAEEDPVYSNYTMATTPPRGPDLGGTGPQTLPLAEGQIGEQLEGMHYASIKHSPQSMETQGQDGAAGRGAEVLYSQVAVKRKPQKEKAEDGAGQGEGSAPALGPEEKQLVKGTPSSHIQSLTSIETESLCVEMGHKKGMEGIPECEYSNVVFKKKKVQQ